MFAAANPYDDLVGKATSEDLSDSDWGLNMELCDKVSGDGSTGARNAVAALTKRLSHRNPSVQLYSLELANTLAQNCGKSLLEELSSRTWTGALDRLVNDRATAAPVKKKALGYIKAWAKQFEEAGDRNLAMMGELYDQLRAKNFSFDEPEPAPEDAATKRQREEDEELRRVLELSKQDKGGRPAASSTSAAGGGGGGSSTNPFLNGPSHAAAGQAQTQAQSSYQPQPFRAQPAAEVYDPQPVLDMNTATRVRAIYAFASAEIGELSFERGDIIKVLDRGFKEWWRGACNGKIGIFPVTYVEAMAEPTARELQDEAQEEAKIFASLGLVDQLLQTLKGIDPSRGDRLEDKPELEELYQASVGLQGQINALIKKYSDQKAELEHMNANFLRAMRQYEELRNPPPPPAGQGAYHYGPPDSYAGQQQQQQQQYPQHPGGPPHSASYNQQQPQQPPQQQQQYQPPPGAYPSSQPAQFPQAVPHGAPVNSSPTDPNSPGQAAPGQYYQHPAHSQASLQRIPSGAPNYPPHSPVRENTDPGAAGIGADQQSHQAAWDAYYRQNGQQPPADGGYPQQQPQPQPYPDQQYAVPQYSNSTPAPTLTYGQSPYPPAGQGRPTSYGGQQVDGMTQGMNRMSVQGQ